MLFCLVFPSAKLRHDGGLDLVDGADAIERLEQAALLVDVQQRRGLLGVHVKTLGDGFRVSSERPSISARFFIRSMSTS